MARTKRLVAANSPVPVSVLSLVGFLVTATLFFVFILSPPDDVGAVGGDDAPRSRSSVFFGLDDDLHRLAGFNGETVRLRHSVMPAVGYGVHRGASARGEAAYASVLTYLHVGGRRLDTVATADNLREVGRALRDSSLSRDEVWITSEVSTSSNGGDARRGIDRVLDELRVSWLDLCLLRGADGDAADAVARAWSALVAARDDDGGRVCRSIGASDLSDKEDLLALRRATGALPEVHAVSWSYHPWVSDARRDLVRWQTRNDVATSTRFDDVLSDDDDDAWPDALSRAARRRNATEAQLLLRWALRKDAVAVTVSGDAAIARADEWSNVPYFDADVDDEWLDDVVDGTPPRRFVVDDDMAEEDDDDDEPTGENREGEERRRRRLFVREVNRNLPNN